MIKSIKKNIKKILWSIGIEIKKINKEVTFTSFDEIYKEKLDNASVIFDIGANQGQSIERFKNLFPFAKIYAFEPIEFEFKKLKQKYINDVNVILNNCAVAEVSGQREFNITAKTGNSSFNKIKSNTKWLKVRSKQFNTNEEEYVKKVERVKIVTLDDYCRENQIKKIDLIKIDTQGYEDKILSGAQNILSKNIISAIECEIMLDNVYEKYLNFSDLEKYLVPNNFRIVGINMINNNLFSGLTFFGDIVYFNKNKFEL